MAKPKPGSRLQALVPLLSERRAWVRYPSDLDGYCQPGAGRKERDLWWQARILNISAGGAGLVLNHRFAQGTILSVELPSTRETPFILQLSRVVHVSAQPDGSWLIGCEFATRLRDSELRALTGDSPAEISS
jgi:hypothetical protein